MDGAVDEDDDDVDVAVAADSELAGDGGGVCWSQPASSVRELMVGSSSEKQRVKAGSCCNCSANMWLSLFFRLFFRL